MEKLAEAPSTQPEVLTVPTPDVPPVVEPSTAKVPEDRASARRVRRQNVSKQERRLLAKQGAVQNTHLPRWLLCGSLLMIS